MIMQTFLGQENGCKQCLQQPAIADKRQHKMDQPADKRSREQEQSQKSNTAPAAGSCTRFTRRALAVFRLACGALIILTGFFAFAA